VRQQEAGVGLPVRGVRHCKFDCRIDQHLPGDRGAFTVARRNGHDGRQIATGAIAAHGKPGRVDAERFRIVRNPSGCSDGIVDRRREFVFGREPIVDGDNKQLSFFG